MIKHRRDGTYISASGDGANLIYIAAPEGDEYQFSYWHEPTRSVRQDVVHAATNEEAKAIIKAIVRLDQ